MVCEINLQASEYLKYSKPTLKLTSVNFLLGRNGTGKSTLTRLIKEQLQNEFDVRIFDGFESLLDENRELNAVALGRENTEIQNQIKDLETKIQATKEENGDLAEKVQEAKSAYDSATKKLNNAMMTAAKDIKEKDNPRIAKTTYNRIDYSKERASAQRLSPQERTAFEEEAIGQLLKLPVALSSIPIDFQKLKERANGLLTQTVVESVRLPEFADNPQKTNFAHRGMEVHNRQKDKVCAFCGGELTQKRWDQLENYFSGKVTAFQTAINACIDDFQTSENSINKITQYDSSSFYPSLRAQVADLNDSIGESKEVARETILSFRTALNGRKDSLFQQVPPIKQVEWPDFKALTDIAQQLIAEHAGLSNTVRCRQDSAKEQLRYHHILEYEKKYEIVKLDQDAQKCETESGKLCKQKEELERKLSDYQENLEKLFGQIKDESLIAERINKYLRAHGEIGFQLVLQSEAERGFYSIQDSDGNIRPITKLSTGEKNIIAFVYFMEAIKAPRDTDKPFFLVLDDPMTSNDDTYQYLIISLIERYYDPLLYDRTTKNNHRGNQLLVLTHNTHFYLNVRPYKNNRFSDKIQYIHLRKGASHTQVVCVSDQKDDIHTSYDELWEELKFAYAENKPEFMWNSMRRIIISFCEFNNLSLNTIIRKSSDKLDSVLCGAFRKSMDVNSHELLDCYSETNGSTCEQIRGYMEQFFSGLNHSEHYVAHWCEHKDPGKSS